MASSPTAPSPNGPACRARRCTPTSPRAAHSRDDADADRSAAAVFEAPTAIDALREMVEFHVAFTPKVMSAGRLVEFERATDRSIESDFAARPAGRRQIVRHVMTRLHAEHQLHETWTIDSAADIVERLCSFTATHELLELRHWTIGELRDRLLHTLQHALLTAPPKGIGR